MKLSASKGTLPARHLVEDDAERVDVGAVVDERAGGLLGAHVMRRPEDAAGLGHLRAGAADLRDAEVEDLHEVFVGARAR